MESARNDAALEILKDQGFEIGEAVLHDDGRVQYRIYLKGEPAWVKAGQELWDLAAGRLTLTEINARQMECSQRPAKYHE